MCTVCGCGDTGKVEGEGHWHEMPDGTRHFHAHGHAHGHDHAHAHGHSHTHDHPHSHGAVTHSHPHAHTHAHVHPHAQAHDPALPHAHHHGHDALHADGAPHDHDHTHGDLHFGLGAAGVSVPGMSQARLIEVETSILAKNDAIAMANRRVLAALKCFALNLVSSPGSGKTTLLVKTIERLGATPLAVIEGDQQTTNDADRIRGTGARAVQVNTGKGCHLDAQMVARAMDALDVAPASLLFIENVGNLVCPAAFDLGEDAKVAVLSVTEGEDKPLKYPDMFTAARLAVLNKVDLAPHCDVDLDLYEANLRRVNPGITVLRVSARTGEGMEAWLRWLTDGLLSKAMRRTS